MAATPAAEKTFDDVEAAAAAAVSVFRHEKNITLAFVQFEI